MTIRMLINATAHNELRIAIVEDGELMELDIEAAESSSLKGNIYKGVVHNVEGSLEAAFVDIGVHKQGFLPFSEVAPAQFYRKWSQDSAPRINDVLRRGQDIIVQVAKDPVGEKGATLTTYLSLPGRYVVLMPGSEANGISRKIEDEKMRRRIKTMAQKIKKPDNCGFIVRTAGLGQTRPAIQRDLDNVVAQWEKMQQASEMARAPSILHAEPDLVARTLRDYFNEEIDEVWIDTRDEYDAAVDYFQRVMPDYAERIKLYQDPIPIFAYYHVEEQIEATFERRVSLPSGGSIVVDQTEALVAIDVNSGKTTSEGSHEETVFKTNCEAAEEAARQLKLRDLGGIVVIDFIDMELNDHKREVERVLSETAKLDKARYKISRINSKGICMLTRQRIRQGMRKAFQVRCPVCTGTGWVRTPESHSLSLVRRVETRLAQGGVGEVRITTHRSTAEYLLNHKRADLLRLEREYHCRVIVGARPDMDRSHDEVTYHSKGELLAEITDRLPPREEKPAKRKRKRSRKKSTSTTTTADSGENTSSKKKKKRKKRSSAKTDGAAAAGKTDEAAPGDGAEERPALAAKGSTTFTGRPSPEKLEQLKAERKARLARRPDMPSNATAAHEQPSRPPEPAAPAAEAGEPTRRSILDRIFGSR